MITATTASETQRFRAAIGRRIGLHFDDAKLGYLAEVLQRHADRCRRGRAAFLSRLECGPSEAELCALAGDLTVGETYFFRHYAQFRTLAEVVLPQRLRVQSPQRIIRLLSAGCSSGEEPYSMAIVVREAFPDPSLKLEIRGIDINPAVLAKARRGRYSTWALRETPPDLRHRWFRAEGRELALDDAVRPTVTFQASNLASDDAALWQPQAYDAIFCRNVLMYFEPEQMRSVIDRVARSLAPDGYLFLGHAETLRGISDQFHLRESHGTFYYQLKRGGDARAPTVVPLAPAQRAPDAGCAPDTRCPDRDVAWFDAIREASERVAALLPTSEIAPQEARQATPSFDPTPTLDLLRRERFGEALAQLRAAVQGFEPSADVLLLEAALLAHGGQFEAAEQIASRLIALNAYRAPAHYVLALCGEHLGRVDHAIAHHQSAIGLDPAFAMPHLHLGLLARRGGDGRTARRAFADALALLEREDASRLLLFGGGFSREALMTLCRSAQRDCGDAHD